MSDAYASKHNSSTLLPLGQVLVDLSNDNTVALLSRAGQIAQNRLDHAKRTLSRLRQLNESVGQQFQPKEDALAQLRLRMICSQDPDPDPISSFIIVSYCWHYPEWPIASAASPIAAGWEISRPMVDAVMGHRESPNEGVWLDKLCINQQDLEEKTIHIASMDVIYRSARRVIILLEDVQLSQDEEAAGVAYAGFYADLCAEVKDLQLEGEEKSGFINEYFPKRERLAREQGKGSVLAAAKAFVMKITGARWYTRAWCAHESRVAPHHKVNNPLFLCYGHQGNVLSFEFRFVHYFAMILSDLEPEMSMTGSTFTNLMNDPNAVTLTQRWWRMIRLMPDRDLEVTAMQHLVSLLSFGCFKKGDLMSIALNTAETPLFFTGDVDEVSDVVWIFALLTLAAGDVVPLIMDGGKLRLKNADGTETISWVTNPVHGSLQNGLPLLVPDSITAVTRDYIELDLLLFKSLPATATAPSLEAASRLIAEHNLATLAQEMEDAASDALQKSIKLLKDEVHRVKGDAGPLETFLPIWLGLAMDCGLEWVLRFPEVMRTNTQDTWLHGTMGVVTHPALSGAAAALLEQLDRKGQGGEGDEAADEEEEKEANGTASKLEQVTRFLTCLLDPRMKLLTINPRRLGFGPADHAITTSGSNRSWIAVPVAIAHLPGWHNRAWTIEPLDLASPREDVKDFLLDTTRGDYGEEDKVEDIFPVLTSDYADRRAEPNEQGTWRLRRRDVVFGHQPWSPSGSEVVDSSSVVILKRQRVYGGEDYDWGAMFAAFQSVQSSLGL